MIFVDLNHRTTPQIDGLSAWRSVISPGVTRSTAGDDVIVEYTSGLESPEDPAGEAGDDFGLYIGFHAVFSGDYLGSDGANFIDTGDGSITYGNDVVIGYGENPYGMILNGDVFHLNVLSTDGGTGAVILGNDALFGFALDAEVHGDAAHVIVTTANGGTNTFVAGDDYLAGAVGNGAMFGDVYSLWVDTQAGQAVVQTGNDIVVGGDYIFGDAAYFETFFDADAPGAGFTDVGFGDDRLVGGTVIYGDTSSAFDGNSVGVSVQGTVTFGNDVLIGGDHTTHLNGDTGQAVFSSLDVIFGDDTIYAGQNDEIITGDNAFDSNDYFSDIITVQYGADTFVFAGDFGNDVILDFNIGLDVIVFDGFDMALEHLIGVNWSGATSSLTIDMTALGGGVLTIENAAGISEDDFLFL